jgi:hypothetical protein
VNAFEDTQRRRSIVSDTLQSLTEQARQWHDKIDLLEAGQQIDRAAALADLGKLLDVCQNLRDAILSEDSGATWHSKGELDALVVRLDEVAAKRCRYLDLAQWLAAGTVTHRRERTKQERLRQRDAAVAELMEISALAAPPELPGPEVDKWLEWACSLDDSTNDPDLKTLNANFPRVDDFVSQLEFELWHRDAETSAAEVTSGNGTVEKVSTGSLAGNGTKNSGTNGTGNNGSNGSGGASGLKLLKEAASEKNLPSAYTDAEAQGMSESSTICATEEAPAEQMVKEETPVVAPIRPAIEVGKLSFFAADDLDCLRLYQEKAKTETKDGRKVRAMLAVSNWLTPRDQNPVLQPRCGIRAQIGYEGKSDLITVTPEEAAKTIDSENGLQLLTGGADLLRWSLTQPAEDGFDAIATVRRLSAEQLRSWFGDLYKIELAEPQVQDMYRLTYGIPLLVGELHRRVILVPEAPPTWLGFAIWTKVKASFEARIPALAEELRSGSSAVKLTEREIAVLKMVVIASDGSTAETIGQNLMEKWHKFHHPEYPALSSADESSVQLLLSLGLLPAKNESGLRPIKALVPVDADDPIRRVVKHL